ncbi:MAG: 50S ribosomal L9 C-terminal domain-containing protein [Solirubrobacteraceae bacterium]
MRDARGLKLDRRKVHLDEPIRNVGIYMLVIEIADEVTATRQDYGRRGLSIRGPGSGPPSPGPGLAPALKLGAGAGPDRLARARVRYSPARKSPVATVQRGSLRRHSVGCAVNLKRACAAASVRVAALTAGCQSEAHTRPRRRARLRLTARRAAGAQSRRGEEPRGRRAAEAKSRGGGERPQRRTVNVADPNGRYTAPESGLTH